MKKEQIAQIKTIAAGVCIGIMCFVGIAIVVDTVCTLASIAAFGCRMTDLCLVMKESYQNADGSFTEPSLLHYGVLLQTAITVGCVLALMKYYWHKL